MFISHKSNVLQTVHETEWQCRRKVKGLNKSEYWAWLDSVTSGDPPVVDYSGETGYTIVECTDEDVQARLVQLGDYQAEGVYNIKWSKNKVNCEEVLDNDGKSQSPKVYVKSHFKGDDTTKDKRLLDEEWVRIRTERTRLLAETDHLALSDQTLSGDMATYRKKLRELPSDQSSKTKYSDITWPTKP
jgi:hypothetical protein